LHGYENAEEIVRIPWLDLEWPLQSLYEEVLFAQSWRTWSGWDLERDGICNPVPTFLGPRIPWSLRKTLRRGQHASSGENL